MSSLSAWMCRLNVLNSRWGKLPTGRKGRDPIPIVVVGCVDYTYETSPRRSGTASVGVEPNLDRFQGFVGFRLPFRASDRILCGLDLLNMRFQAKGSHRNSLMG
jgi:hypothetical protein